MVMQDFWLCEMFVPFGLDQFCVGRQPLHDTVQVVIGDPTFVMCQMRKRQQPDFGGIFIRLTLAGMHVNGLFAII